MAKKSPSEDLLNKYKEEAMGSRSSSADRIKDAKEGNTGYWNPEKPASKESKKSGVDLADGESKAVSGNEKQQKSDAPSFGYTPSGGKSGRAAQVAKVTQKVFGGKKKYGWGVGGIIGIIVMILFFFAPLLGPMHMFNNLQDYHLGPRRDTINVRTIKTIKNLRANRVTTPDTDPVTKRLNEVSIDDLSTEFKAKGLTLELDTNGSPSGLRDVDGLLKSLDNVDEVALLVDDAVPISRSTGRGYFRKLFTAQTGYSWSSILGKANPDESLWSWLRSRARISAVNVSTNIKNSASSDTVDPVVLDDYVSDINTGSDAADEALKASQTKALDGGAPADVTKAGTDSLSKNVNSKSLTVATFILACTSQAVYDSQLQMRWNNLKSAVNTFFDLAIISNEIQTGSVNTASHVGDFMNQYSNETGSFASSAAWQEISGQPVTGPGLLPENDVNSSLTSDDFLGSILGGVSGVGGVVSSIPGLSDLCSLFNAAIGTVVGGVVATVIDWGANLIELTAACTVGTVVSLGGTCAAKIGTVAALEIGLPRLFGVILSAFVEKIIEDPAQAFNYLSHAGALVNSETSRTGRPVDNETYLANDLQPYLDKTRENANKTFYARWLSKENPYSFMTQVGQWKTNLMTSRPNIGQSIVSVLKSPITIAGSILNNGSGLTNRVLAQNYESSPHASVQKYSYRTASLDSDPIILANEVRAMLENNDELQKTARYCMGYDYQNDAINESLQLPLYSNPGEDPGGLFGLLGIGEPDAEQKNALVQQYCVPSASGQLSSGVSLDDYEKLGRFVDDLIIIESMITYLNPGDYYSSGNSASTSNQSPNGNDPVPSPESVTSGIAGTRDIACTGTNVPAGASLQSALNGGSNGETFCLSAGTYTRQTITPKSGQQIIGALGAVMDGENSTEYAFNGTASNVTIKNIEIKNYTNRQQRGAINSTGSSGWLVEFNEIHSNEGAGIALEGENHIIRDNFIHHQNQIGIKVVRATDVVVEGNEISYNNYNVAYNWGWEAGGTKFAYTTNLVVRNNYSHNNHGPGLWTDISNYNTLYENNLIEDNYAAGLFHEISYKATIRNNTIRRNGFGHAAWLWGAGIVIAASQDVDVYGNTIEGNANGISVIQQNRGSGDRGPYIARNNSIHDNTVSGGASGAVQDIGSTAIFNDNNIWYGNTYPGPHRFAWNNNWFDFARWVQYHPGEVQ